MAQPICANIQLDYLYALQNLDTMCGGMLRHTFEMFTMLGERLILMIFIAIVYWVINTQKGVFLLINLIFGIFLNAMLKTTFCIYRPWVLDSRITPSEHVKLHSSGYSFPSGHTTRAMAVWGASVFAFAKNNKFLSLLFILIVMFVMLSRNILGVHYPQDVLVACFIGVCLIFLVDRFQKWLDKDKNNDIIGYLTIILVTILGIVYVILKPYPVDYLNGQLLVSPKLMQVDAICNMIFVLAMALGLLINSRFIHFDAKLGTAWDKFLRLIVGIPIIVYYQLSAKPVLNHYLNEFYTYCIFYFMLPLLMIIICPIIFKTIEQIKLNVLNDKNNFVK